MKGPAILLVAGSGEYFREGVSYSSKEMGKEKAIFFGFSCDWGKKPQALWWPAWVYAGHSWRKQASPLGMKRICLESTTECLNYPFLECPASGNPCFETINHLKFKPLLVPPPFLKVTCSQKHLHGCEKISRWGLVIWLVLGGGERDDHEMSLSFSAWVIR